MYVEVEVGKGLEKLPEMLRCLLILPYGYTLLVIRIYHVLISKWDI
jgi:hypothetical protein